MFDLNGMTHTDLVRHTKVQPRGKEIFCWLEIEGWKLCIELMEGRVWTLLTSKGFTVVISEPLDSGIRFYQAYEGTFTWESIHDAQVLWAAESPFGESFFPNASESIGGHGGAIIDKVLSETRYLPTTDSRLRQWRLEFLKIWQS